MFQDKNNNTEQENFDASLSSVLAPIHLMKTDLEEIKNPKKSKPEQASPSMFTSSNLSEKQKASPFFNAPVLQKNLENKPQEAPVPLPPLPPMPPKESAREMPKEGPREFGSSTFIPQQKEITKKETSSEITKNSALNKILVAFAVFFLFLIFGAGGYYFWITKNFNQPAESENNPPTEIPNETEPHPVIVDPESVKQAIDISTENPNYLSIDIENGDKISINNQIDLYIAKAKELKITAPIEFTVTDTANNPVSFKVFAEKIGIALPEQIISLLGEKFSLLIFNDNENYRLGLSVNSLNDIKLKAEMLKEETNLVADLSPLLKNPENKPLAKNKYQAGLYKKVNSIRFSNIVSPEYLSIDYMIKDSTWTIGTTKNTIFAIIDYLSKPKKTTSIENIVKTPEIAPSSTTPENTAATK